MLSYADYSGLRVNFDKSLMLPINVSDDRLDPLANACGCPKGTISFTYWGLPLSTTKPSVANFWPLLSKCARRLMAFSSLLSRAGRLEMTNVVLTALLTFAMCTFFLTSQDSDQIDRQVS